MRIRTSIVRFGGIVCIMLICGGWGPRGHESANAAAVQGIPPDGPVFLKQYADWIAKTGPVPDSWRGNTEPYSKIFEDPNHGWFKEQFAFMETIPRSRYEFVLRLYDEYLKIREKEPERAALMNVRWTGTMPYAAMETYDRMKAAMRAYRRAIADDKPESKAQAGYLAQDIAFYMGWLGHYTADGAQPLHDTIHHDGWVGPNPKAYATERVHGRFETQFVDLIQLTSADLMPLMEKPKVLVDPFAAFVAHLDDAATHVEEVYQLDKSGALADKSNQQAAKLVRIQLTKAAALLRDLTYTAWIESAKAPAAGSGPEANPINQANPRYNPETGTAAPGAPIRNVR
jgi:hypothetical protein